VNILPAFLLLSLFCRAEVPAGFSWVNLESDSAVMTKVRQALHDKSVTAIREVGVEDGFALVMTASREDGAPTPDYDRWTIYNISLANGASRVLVSGYGVQLHDWIGSKQDELAITYYDCWECEAARLFTTLHFAKDAGWSVRWTNKTGEGNYPQPGVLVSTSDVPDSPDDEVDVVFAVIAAQKNGFGYVVGSWVQSRNLKSRTVEDDAARYTVDQISGQERVEKLTGQAALNWERMICTGSNIMLQPSSGQDSKACKRALRISKPPSANPH
jgi:hypothetical protein